jgi:membrane protease YdiL (CAAX protease family)
VLTEIAVLWIVTLVLIRIVKALHELLGVHELVLALVPILFMYMPVALCRWRGVDSYAYPLALPSFREGRVWRDALVLNLGVIGVILLPWLVGYHLFHTEVAGILGELGLPGMADREFEGVLPDSILKLVGYHLFFVAIPEEFFYRGYIQSRLDEIWAPKWRVLGAMVGPSLIVTSLIFAFGHSVVVLQWWHFAIFFPSLVFGWMRARTGDVMAGAFFHAWANVTVTVLDTLYGIVPPAGL